jgi:hypothetical protein
MVVSQVDAGEPVIALTAVRRDPAPDRPAQAEAAPHMIAWRSTPGSAQERCARRALVNSLDGSVDTLAAADRGLGGLGTTLPHAAMACYESSRSA